MSPGSNNGDSFNGQEQRLAAKKSYLWLRARIIQGIRLFFIENGYLEVETPYLIPAPAPELHIDAISAGEAFLHTSPELCMKRLISAGYPKLFQICRCFRQGERGQNHLPEFTILEWYRAGIDYRELMDEVEEMITFVSRRLGFGESIEFRGHAVGLKSPWQRISVREAFQRYASMSLESSMDSGRFDEVMVQEIEPNLGITKPTFLHDYPASLAALARLKQDDPAYAERFELYVAGLEVANAFTELTDAHEQRERFECERERRRQQGKTVYPLPEKFLRSLHNMPHSAGIALGVDRLVMLFADQPSIDQVVSFTPEEL
jgi:lysyl-tRNA synthetase class 2